MLTYHRTSLLTSQAQTVVNTVNTVGVMGKGIAAAFKDRYPAMFSQYKRLCEEHQLDIGKLWLWRGADQWVLNFPTKKHWRNPSKLSYIESGLQKFVAEYERQGIREISFPRLGCGNGGLNWDDVRPLMEHYLSPLPIPVYIHDFEKAIGAPEHLEKVSKLSQTRFDRSFHSLLSDIKTVTELRNGHFETLIVPAPFNATITNDGDVNIAQGDQSGRIPNDDLYEVWTLLLKGPVSKRKTSGEAHDWADYLFAIMSHLPYVRPIEIGVRDQPAAVAIELVDDTAIQSIDLNKKQGEFLWA